MHVMRGPLILLLASAALAAGFYAVAGNRFSDPALLALLGAVAAFVLVLLSARSCAAPQRQRQTKRQQPHAATLGKPILVDGSNVLHWNGETPRIATLKEVIASLKAQGYAPGVVFDANAGYKIGDRYMGDKPFAKALGLPTDRVLVVPKGTPADAYLLAAARNLGAAIVTNDRYRDWAETYPEVASPGLLRRGGYQDGRLWLETAP